jgi:hypothetical protein
MFSKITLFHANELHTIEFKPEKTYLLMVAQGCDVSTLPFTQPLLDVYTITTPAVIWQSALHHDALLCCELSLTSEIIFCRSEKDASPDTILKSRTVMMFVQWLDPKIYRYIDKLFNLTPEDATIMGIGCGRTDGVELPAITYNANALENGFLILFSTNTSTVGSAHGSDFHSGFFIAHTENSNRIVTINGEKAFPFYQKMVQTQFNEVLTPETIFSIGLKYPFGLGSLQGQQALRVPVGVENESIIVAGPMDEEVMLCLMRSTPSGLLKAPFDAMDAAKVSAKALLGKECFIIECVGREQLLGENFTQELQAIAHEMHNTSSIYGVLSLGEIANNAARYIEYFNESCVIGVIDAAQ